MYEDKKSYRVLIIEDSEGDLLIVEDFLLEQIADIIIIAAGNFKEASKILSDRDSVFDVILLDLTLPDKSGQQLVSEILSLSGSCPVIILTGNLDIDFSIRSISQGIMDYLIKDDLNATTLYKSILYAIERKKASYQLKESEKRYSDIFHLSPQPMWVYEMASLKFSKVNKAAIELYGYSGDEFLEMSVIDIIADDEITNTQGSLSTCKMEVIEKGEFRHRKKSGEILEVAIYSTPIIIDDKSYRTVIAIDVTEKNLMEHKVTKAIIKTQEDERYEIGSELHDNVCQLLATSKLSLGMLKDSMAPANMQWFQQCHQYIVMALEEIRNLSHRLAPAFFDNTTLEEAFGKLLASFNVHNKYEILLKFSDGFNKYPLSLDIQLNLYRILQEQLKNIEKYANASLIEVDMIFYNKKFKMNIKDNGIGFNVDSVKGGIGIANMKRRAELFSGKLTVASAPGEGCTIVVDICANDSNV